MTSVRDTDVLDFKFTPFQRYQESCICPKYSTIFVICYFQSRDVNRNPLRRLFFSLKIS